MVSTDDVCLLLDNRLYKSEEGDISALLLRDCLLLTAEPSA